MPDVRIADVDVTLRLPLGNWDGFFPPAKEKAKGFLDFYYENTPLEFHDPTLNRNQRKIIMCCQINNDGYPLFSIPAPHLTCYISVYPDVCSSGFDIRK